jgi:hypothetical protein
MLYERIVLFQTFWVFEIAQILHLISSVITIDAQLLILSDNNRQYDPTPTSLNCSLSSLANRDDDRQVS